MNQWICEFFGAGTEPEFALLTFAHFAPILLMLAMIFVIYRGRKKLRTCKRENVFRYTMAFTLIISEMAYYWRLVGIPALGPNPIENLPITLCGWAAIFCSYMVVGKNRTLFNICYFWLLAGSVFALATPTALIYTGPARFRYYQFWAEHIISYVAIFYMIFVHGMRPSVKGAIRSYVWLAALALVAYFANTIIGDGANYLFLARPETVPSILDILPTIFALRTIIMAVGIGFLYCVAYLPWYFQDKKKNK